MLRCTCLSHQPTHTPKRGKSVTVSSTTPEIINSNSRIARNNKAPLILHQATAGKAQRALTCLEHARMWLRRAVARIILSLAAAVLQTQSRLFSGQEIGRAHV